MVADWPLSKAPTILKLTLGPSRTLALSVAVRVGAPGTVAEGGTVLAGETVRVGVAVSAEAAVLAGAGVSVGVLVALASAGAEPVGLPLAALAASDVAMILVARAL